MPEDHRHCIVCGKATVPEKFFCSPSCEEIFKKQQKRMARMRFFMMMIFVVLLVLILIASMSIRK